MPGNIASDCQKKIQEQQPEVYPNGFSYGSRGLSQYGHTVGFETTEVRKFLDILLSEIIFEIEQSA